MNRTSLRLSRCQHLVSSKEVIWKAGWSSEEVTDVFGFDFRVQEKERKPVKKLSPELLQRIGKLAESVSRSSPKVGFAAS
ncbi:Tudor domain-containing protein 5 [Bienertia sinuspersici]